MILVVGLGRVARDDLGHTLSQRTEYESEVLASFRVAYSEPDRVELLITVVDAKDEHRETLPDEFVRGVGGNVLGVRCAYAQALSCYEEPFD